MELPKKCTIQIFMIKLNLQKTGKMKVLFIVILFLFDCVCVTGQTNSFEIGYIEGDSILNPIDLNKERMSQLIERELPQLGPLNRKVEWGVRDTFEFIDFNWDNIICNMTDDTVLVFRKWNKRLLLLTMNGPNYNHIIDWAVVTTKALDSIKNEHYFYLPYKAEMNLFFKTYSLNGQFFLMNSERCLTMTSRLRNIKMHNLNEALRAVLPPEYKRVGPDSAILPEYDKLLFWDSTFRIEYHSYRGRGYSNPKDIVLERRYYIEFTQSFKVKKHFEMNKGIELSSFYWEENSSGILSRIASLNFFSNFLSDSLNHLKKYEFDFKNKDSFSNEFIYKLIKSVNDKSGVKNFVITPLGLTSSSNSSSFSVRCGTIGSTVYHLVGFYAIDTNKYEIKNYSFRYTDIYVSDISSRKIRTIDGYLLVFCGSRIVKYDLLKGINNNNYKLIINCKNKNTVEMQMKTNGYLERLTMDMYSKRNIGHSQTQYRWFVRRSMRLPTFRGKNFRRYTYKENDLRRDSVNVFKLKPGTYYFRIRPEYRFNSNAYVTSSIGDYTRRHKGMFIDEEYYYLNLFKMPFDEDQIIEYAFKIKIRRFGKPKIKIVKLKNKPRYE